VVVQTHNPRIWEAEDYESEAILDYKEKPCLKKKKEKKVCMAGTLKYSM
jgi:hypothetical protein